jgi:hypothetical protein
MDPKPAGTFIIFRFTLVAVIFIESVLTAFYSLHSTTESHLGAILPWFASLEALAALLLLVPKTVKIGGAILLVIFIVALVVHGPAQQMSLFVYAAGVVLLMANSGANFRGASRSNDGIAPEE